jgi:hypothetical protein
MAKVVYKNLKLDRTGKAAARAVGKKRIGGLGGWRTVHTLDAHSKSFDEDLQYVFSKNVAKARRENKRLTGSSDIAPRKA